MSKPSKIDVVITFDGVEKRGSSLDLSGVDSGERSRLIRLLLGSIERTIAEKETGK